MKVKYMTAMLLSFFSGLLVFWLLQGQPGSFAEEDGPLEIWSACLLFLAAGLSFWIIPVRYLWKELFLPFGFFQLGLRELPVDLWIFDERVLTLAFYRTEGLSLASVMGGLYAVVALWSVLTLLIWGLPQGWRALRQHSAWLAYFNRAVVCAILAQLSEEVLKRGVVGEGWSVPLHILEEGFEALFALGLCQALYVAWRRD